MRIFPGLLAAAILAGCNQAAEKPAVPPPRVDKNAVIFEPASPQLGSIRTASAEPQREEVLRFNGRLVWDEDRTARVYTPFAGKVLSIAARSGDKVKAGQVLAVLSAPELGSAQAEARKAEQDFLLAQKNRARIEELFVLRSPLSGVVVERQLNPSQELRPDAAPQGGIFVISDPSRLWFVLDVSDKDLVAVRPGIEVSLSTAALGDERVAGRITYVADVVDPQTRTIKVRGTLANAERKLKAEMFVTGEIRVPAGIGLLVPGKAVYLRGEQYFVFVDAGNSRFERRAVRLGTASNGYSLILEGIGANDKVVTEGSLLLERVLASKD